MANWTTPSNSNKLNVSGVDIRAGFSKFTYYESLFSPHITATLTFMDTGNSFKAGSGKDVQERVGTVFSSVPSLENSEVVGIIENESGRLSFDDDYPFIVTKINRAEDNKRQVISLRLSTKYGIKNENSAVYEKYYNNITNSVKNILEKKLEISTTKIKTDPTKNSQSFIGGGKRPFDLILELCRKSIPIQGSPGFLFYENKEGFNFKAIDTLIASETVGSYIYSDVATFCNASNFRILSYNPQKDGDILSALRAGMYQTKNIFFDPYSFDYNEVYVKLSDTKIKRLGSEEITKIYQDTQETFTRTHSFIIDSGNMEVGITSAHNTFKNNQPLYWQAESVMRYNLLYSKVIDIVIPCNLKLKAGDTINCSFPKITDNEPQQGILDETTSGKYLILHLAHNFTSDGRNGSTTHLSIVRDTYGLYTTEGGN